MIEKLGVMVDCSRNGVMTVETVKRLIDVLSAMGYRYLGLYTEDTFEVNNEPHFGCLRGRYSKEELKELDAYALQKGMLLKPYIQTLAHLNCIFLWDEYYAIKDIDDILLVGEERAYELIDHIFQTLAECFTTREVNIGMDEAHHLGRGKYLDKNGYTPPVEIMQKHLKRVLEIANNYGFTCEVWGDMFYNMAFNAPNATQETVHGVSEKIPRNLKLAVWDYYGLENENYIKEFGQYRQLTKNLIFAGGALTWMGFCPDNRYSIAATKQAILACEAAGIDEACITLWGDDGGECSPFAALPALFASAEYAHGNFDEALIRERFRCTFGIDFDSYCLLDEPNFAVPCEELKFSNAAKYLLYNDVFLGRENRAAVANRKEFYEDLAEKLSRETSHKEYGYIFKMEEMLCRALALKYDFGVRLRNAYSSKDKVRLQRLCEEMSEIKLRVQNFYTAFEAYWMRDKKPQGFDVQDIRLGGLMQRIVHCQNRLQEYLCGNLETLSELEEMPPEAAIDNPVGRYCCHYRIGVTANVI